MESTACMRFRATATVLQVATDPSDDLVLEVAVAGGCNAIITYNKRHFRNVEEFGVRILNPREFLAEIGEIS